MSLSKNSNLAFLASILLLSGIMAKAQDYVPFPTDSAFWKTSFTNTFNPVYTTFDLLGDTVVDSKLYHKIYSASIKEIPQFDTTYYPNKYMGCMREESKIVYFIYADSLAENVIYNFNLGIGDTVAPYVYPCINDPFVITSIDTVTLADGTLRKGYMIHSCGNATAGYTEGIGNAYGPIPFYGTSFGPGSYAPSLTCFIDHGISLLNQSNGDCASLPTGTNEISDVGSKISVYPNPIQDLCIINFGRVIQEGELKIFDEQGRIVMTKIFANTDQQIISSSELPFSTIYMLTIITKNEVFSSKMVINR